MKKIIAVFTALVLMCACAAAEGMPAMDFSGAFAHPSNEFSMETAFFVLSTFMQQDAPAARTAFEAMGFEVVKQEHYGKDISDHSHTSAYTFAKGMLPVRGEMRETAVVTIRGTGDGEWYSNFDFAGENKGNARYAENFKEATDDIFEGISGEISAMENPVVIATGYSRGAGCANLLGELLNEIVLPEDVYVYTFATPNTIIGEHPAQDNIFNIVNMNDMITRMPPAQWGFSRLGTDIELCNEEYDAMGMHMMFMEMLGLCPDIDAYYNDRHSLTGYGLADDGATAFEMFQLVAGVLTGEEQASAQMGMLMESAQQAPNDFTATLMLFMNASGFDQHMPEAYVELMMKMAGN